jgi:hypothetical protein
MRPLLRVASNPAMPLAVQPLLNMAAMCSHMWRRCECTSLQGLSGRPGASW